MSLFNIHSFIQITHSPGRREKGKWVEGEKVPVPFGGTAQPASGKAMEILPDGKRNRETITVCTADDLHFTAAEPTLERSGDLIVWEGQEYEVQNAKAWKGGLLPHWELLCTRIKEGES